MVPGQRKLGPAKFSLSRKQTCRLRRLGTEMGFVAAGPDLASRSWTAASASQARKSDAGRSLSGPAWFLSW